MFDDDDGADEEIPDDEGSHTNEIKDSVSMSQTLSKSAQSYGLVVIPVDGLTDCDIKDPVKEEEKAAKRRARKARKRERVRKREEELAEKERATGTGKNSKSTSATNIAKEI